MRSGFRRRQNWALQMQAEDVGTCRATARAGGEVREAAGIHVGRRSDDRGAERSHSVAGEKFRGGGNPAGEGGTGVIGGEIDAVAAVDLPVDETRDDVSAAVAVWKPPSSSLSISNRVARDDD